MKYFTILLLATIIACEPEKSVVSRFKADVTEAKVFIDGEEVGTTPMDIAVVPSTHIIKVYHPDYPDITYEKTYTLAESSAKVIEVALKKQIDDYEKKLAEERKEAERQRKAEERRKKLAEFKKQLLNQIAKNMVYVEGGTFTMGCTSEQSDCNSYERPTHRVTLDGFWIGKYEVTQAQWEAVMGSNPSSFKDCGGNCPVETVSWNDVQEFLKKLNQMTGKNYRLPTEAQWEYAARGGSKSKGYKYSGSNSMDSVAWYDGNYSFETHAVGQKSPNELGIYDMRRECMGVVYGLVWRLQ